MAHHSIGDVGDGHLGSWGFPSGGMGAVADAIRDSAEALGAAVRTGARVEHVIVEGGRARGVVLGGGEEVRAPVVVSAVHPKLTFLEQVDRAELPDDFVADLERWRSRSGVVKINLALAELPDFTADRGTHPQEHHTGAIELALSPGYVEQAFQDAKAGRGAARPFSDGCIPSVLDPTLCPEGIHVMSLFAQWCPHEWAAAPHTEELEAFADRVIEGYAELAPNLPGAILHREVLGPWQMEQEYGLVGGNIFHGELSLEQLFHLRPAPGYADYRSPIAGLYQASSATHGGGGVCGIPGHHAVRAILADRRHGLRRRQAARWP
jgi:phytoene dehydrogenase-like protein